MWIYRLISQKIFNFQRDGICNSVGYEMTHCRLVEKQLVRQASLKKEKSWDGHVNNNVVYVPKGKENVTQSSRVPLDGVASTKEVQHEG